MGISEQYPNDFLLVNADWVEQQLHDEQVVIIDARPKGYEEGHIPGAVSLTSGQLKAADGIHIISSERFTELAQERGINADTTVIVYDDGLSNNSARVFYALEYYGKWDNVRILNGGFTSWKASGKTISKDTVEARQGNFEATINPELITTQGQLVQELNGEQVVHLDARTIEEFRGTELRNNERGGYIPGAIHLEWTDTIDKTIPDQPKFKSYLALKQLFESAGVQKEKTIVPYCQTNVRGAHQYFVLRLLGYQNVRPYEGSWAEWGNDPNTPIAID
ncbi:sulfurtransferase [Cohnella abietis]|uniref:Sulfurtransferase n=1 Tax=Cohnella abietis TaxID=2507935 RepID=A0A3T1D7D7_9BACL|nr:sulfurtransferase [Cohnella abietis]BBI34007.1 sulfurtransferase [Cohnella abietis]